MRIETLIISVIVGLLISSCQGPNKAGLVPSQPLKAREPLLSKTQEDFLRKKVSDWNGLSFDSSTLSLDTALKVTEDYLQAREMLHKNEMEDYEEALSFFEQGQISTKPQLPVQDFSLLIQRFKAIKDRFQYSKKADAIYYLLGFTLYEQDRRDEAVKVFDELVKKYPQSGYWMEVNFRLGEFFFETGQMAEAIEAYGRILNFPQTVFYDKALYKLGWVYYKGKDFKKAIDTFLLIADKKNEDGHGESGLKEESLSCVAKAMSRFSDMNQAVEYFKSKGVKDYTYDTLNKLADSFSEEGRYESALPILKQLAESFPDLLSRPFIYEKMSFVYERMGNEKEAARVRKELMEKHSPETEWYKKNCTEGKCEKIDEFVSNTVLSSLKSQHLLAKSKDNPDLSGVINGYRQFITYYPKSQNLKEVNLLLAEALFDAKMYSDAVDEYEKTAQIYPEGAERGEIVYNAILTHEILSLKGGAGSGKIMDSMKQILATYKTDLAQCEKLEQAIFKTADMCAQNGLYSAARDIISPLLEGSNPLPAYQKTAELFLMEKNFVAAEELYSRIVGISGEPALKEELARVRYDIAEGQLKEGKYEEAAAMFDRAFKAYPKAKVGEASLLKLGSVYIRTGNIKKIKETAKRVLETFPDSTNTISLLIESGYVIAKEDPIEAARFYEDAIAVAVALNKAGKFAIDAGKLILSTSELYENGKNYSKVEQLLIKYLEVGKPGLEGEAEILLKLAHAQFMTKKKEKGIENLNRVAGMEGNISPELVAKARLTLVKEKQEAYLAIKLMQPFEKTLIDKTALLDDLTREYMQIAKYKIFQSEVFFQMGVTFENFRDSILQAEKPADLSKEELAEYRFLLEEKAYPYEEQAVKAYEKSLKVGRTVKASQEWIENSIARLAVIKPALYKREFLKIKKVESFMIEPEPVNLGSSL